ncbi:heme acquisition protein HasA [Phytopseudomonas dryadis]|uniref:Heme acquisition protein HasAp n=1 Tax=Phytopseudomonas dryadis TaxID=2487520 RepID=A0A4Q9QVR8_9GAMM|nr:heme acquisition protein HasA [Pseudomonas dryadis]TBU86876.1 heme acquisition protein HasAp [Pseudomonas dryadis]
MSVTLSYGDDTWFPGITSASDSLYDVLFSFQNDGVAGSHPSNTGGFYGDNAGIFSGEIYAYADVAAGFAFSAYGDLSYYFSGVSEPNVPGADNHTLYGTLEKLELGGGVDSNGQVVNPFLTITFDTPLVTTALNGHDGSVHDIIWGLMNGSIEGYYQASSGASQEWGGLLAYLDGQLDVNDSVENLGSPLSTSEAAIVGIAEAEDYLLAA